MLLQILRQYINISAFYCGELFKHSEIGAFSPRLPPMKDVAVPVLTLCSEAVGFTGGESDFLKGERLIYGARPHQSSA